MRKGMEHFINNPIYTITAEAMSNGRNNIEVVGKMLEAGIKFIQYREKEKPALERYQECMQLVKMTKEAGAIFIIDDFVDLAMAVNADGVHIGQTDLPPQVVRQLIGEDKILGLSTHEAAHALKAVQLGADYIGVGAVFSTNTKKNTKNVTIKMLQEIVKAVSIPVVAIGGINCSNVKYLHETGISGIAVVSAILGAAQAYSAAKKMKKVVISTLNIKK